MNAVLDIVFTLIEGCCLLYLVKNEKINYRRQIIVLRLSLKRAAHKGRLLLFHQHRRQFREKDKLEIIKRATPAGAFILCVLDLFQHLL